MTAVRLIFISGWATDTSCWDPVISKLDRSVLSRHVKWWQCLNEAGQDNGLLRVLSKEKIGVIIIGWSLGTLVALEGAACWPESVKALVLVSGTARMTSEGNYLGVDSRVLRAMGARFRRTPRPVLGEFGRLCVGDYQGSSIEVDRFVEKFVEEAECLDLEHLAAGLRYLQERDLRGILPKIRIPVRLLHGDCDKIIPVECAQYMERVLPEARLDVVHGGPHALLHTAPGRVAELIRDELSSLRLQME